MSQADTGSIKTGISRDSIPITVVSHGQLAESVASSFICYFHGNTTLLMKIASLGIYAIGKAIYAVR